ncbi:fibronectin type III domain-containing protein [Polaribacter batillariae]|uniref:Fibronectin type III domain-containing protein n=1 Tax=Polaribacter batillariae TaxID=2808900 RepID=A0ABX7SRZ5_9FLAO|nr:GEVED domain-containing protein [Polaribacter batillariae]QTD36306.1 fibronectin type III domain-containing protein [Polaribacter batillariae]
MKKNNVKIIVGSLLSLLLLAFFIIKENANNKMEQILSQREKLENYVKNSPFKETLTWDKKKRKLNGLPPNRYYEQMWELTINPATGELDDGELTQLRARLHKKRGKRKNPGNATNAWTERGPNNIGGRTRVIMFDPNDATNNTVYAGGVSGGLWKNTNISNANSQWSRVTNVPGNLSVTSITVDPRDSDRWYVGTGEQYTAGDVVGNGVYVTVNGGDSWTPLTIPAAGPDSFNYNASNLFLKGIYYVNDILAWDNGVSTELFVAVGAHSYGDAKSPSNWLGLQSTGIYRSTNNGLNWNRIESANLTHTFNNTTYYYIPNDFEVGADNRIWMGTIGSALGEGGGRVYSSTNGSTWTEAATSPLPNSNRVELEASATNANKLYALTQGTTEAAPVHIYKTTSAFDNITPKTLPNDADNGIAANDFCRGQAFYDLVIEADPTNDETVFVGGIDLFKSTSGANSWVQISKWSNNPGLNTLDASLVHADQHSIAFGNNDSSEMLFGNDGGVYYSGNSGNTINSRNKNYNVTQFVKAAIGPDGVGDEVGIFSAGSQDNGTQAFRDGNTSVGINSSEELSDGDGFYTFVDKDGEYVIATFINNVIYRFNLPWNGLGRKEGAATSLSNSKTTGDFVNQMGYDSDANRLLSNNTSVNNNVANYSIRSINVAANSSGTITNNSLTAKPTAFRASPFANNTWYVGLANGRLLKLTDVTNSSATWAIINTPFVGAISSIRYGETANDIMVTIHNYGVTSVWYSANAGNSWVSKEGNLPNIPVRDFLQNPLARNEAILATQLGVWATTNFNNANPTWTQSYNGMSDVSVTSFDYWAVGGDDTNNKIIASTYGRGVFTGKFTANVAEDTQAPTQPTNLTTSNVTTNSVNLSWTASTDNTAVTGYDVYRNGTLVTTVTSTSYTATGLTAGTNYSFYIVAKDEAGNVSSASSTQSITTLAPDTTAPSAPTSLASSGKTNTSVTLTWNASTDNVAVTSYDVLRGNTVVGNTANTNFTVSGLTANTTYSFTVRAKDEAGNVSSASNSITITTDTAPVNYCASQSSNVNDEYISRVQLGSIDNPSGAQFYSDFTAISTSLIKGNTYTVTVTPTWTGTSYNEGYSVWIDFNKDGDFTDAGEQVLSNAPSQSATVSASFTVPVSAVTNTTRMRVSMSYNAIPTSCQSFTYGEVEDYTVNIGASGPDTQAPTNPSALVGTNITETTVDLSWTASTDNVAVTEYDVFRNGTKITTVTSTSYQATGLSENTSYVFTVRAKDAAGNVSGNSNSLNVTTLAAPTCSDGIQNGDETGIDCGGASCSPCQSASVVLNQGFFETGLDGWIDGGSDCARVNSSYSYEGSYSVRIRDNSGVSSAMTLSNVNLTPYTQVSINFFFYAYSMENGEDFWLRYYNGTSWTTVQTYVSGTDFENNTYYEATVTLSSLDYTFASNAGFRFQNDASANADQIYIDQVTITGSTGNASIANTLESLNSVNVSSAAGTLDNRIGDVLIYPIPAENILNINPIYNLNSVYKIIDLTGKTILRGKLFNNTIDISNLKTGVYFVELSDEEETFLQKFIKN